MTYHRFASATLVTALLYAGCASAQQASATQGSAETLLPTLSITAQVQADSITIRQRGEAAARIWAEPGGEGIWKLDRGPLPDPIPVGKTFRNVGVTLDARATIQEDGAVRVGAAVQPATPTPKPQNGDN